MTFEEFYNQYYLNACIYATRKVGNPDDGEELTCAVFMYCYQHFSEYDSSKASIGTWLYVIMNSRIKNYYRDKKEHIDLDALGDTLSDDRDIIGKAIEVEENRRMIAKALKDLPETQRAIVVYRYIQDKSTAEVAEILGLSEGNVRTQLSRALAKMRSVLADEIEEY